MSKVHRATHVGKIRQNNEDSLIVLEPETFVVADGMGGAAAGEIASRMLVDTVKNFLPAVPEPWSEDILKKAVLKANAAILRAAQADADRRGMGTTATILHIYKGRAYYAHVGDSRLYRMKNGRFEQITEDHSYVEDLVRRGALTPEAARVHPLKNLLTRAIGVSAEISVDTASFPVESGDIFLLCTDGLTNMVDDEAIAEILNANATDPAAALIEAALDSGGVDNISAIVVEID